MAVEEFETGFGAGERNVDANEAALSFSPSLAEQFRLYFDEQNKQRRRLGGMLLDRLDERNQDPEREGADVIRRVADDAGESMEAVHYAWIVLHARGDVVRGPDGRTVTARSLESTPSEDLSRLHDMF